MIIRRLFIAALLARAADAATGAHDPHDARQAHRSRHLQSNDPCTASESDAKIFDYSLTPTVTFFKPSYFERCLESFQFNDTGTGMLDHIDGLTGVFSQYHSFFDIAKDPKASDPLNYQADLGYQVYGKNSGQVDLQAGLQAIYDEVSNTKVAGQATFWNISTLINQLRDAHIQLELSALYPAVEMTIIPERVITYNRKGGDVIVDPVFSLHDNQQLQLELHFLYDNNDEEQAQVSTIDGKSVHEFMTTNLANEPAIALGYQSLGARINAMIYSMAPFNFPFGYLLITGRPSDVLPDEFEVVYDDDTRETFYAAIAMVDVNSIFSLDESSSEYTVDRTYYEALARQPGKMRTFFDVALGKINAAPYTPIDVETQQQQQTVSAKDVVKEQVQSRRRRLQAGYLFEDIIPSDYEASDAAAIKIDGDYAILKLQSFMISGNQTAYIYYQVAQAAKEAGVKKLMIDVSNNGGGLAMSGLTLAHLMYPSVDILTWFQNRWQVRYNDQMESFSAYSIPLLEDIILIVLNDTVSSDFQASIVNTTADAIKTASITVNNMDRLCPSQGIACQAFLPGLKEAMASYASSQSPDEFLVVLQSLLGVLLFINPWTVGLPQSWLLDPVALLSFVGNMTIENINYGGTTSSYTERFDLGFEGSNSSDSLESIADLVATTTEYLDGFTFDEFLIVSNGAAGSTTSIFVSTAEQIWKNRDRSGVSQPLTTLAFGGSGQADEIALTSFPASIRDVNLDYPLVAYAAMYAWEALVSGNAEYAALVNTARTSYDDVLKAPPYYSVTIPTLPVVTYYDTFMGPDALPMQYIFMPPDEYIAKIYTGVSFDDATDLEALYADASAYFPSGSGSGDGNASSTAHSACVHWSILALIFFAGVIMM